MKRQRFKDTMESCLDTYARLEAQGVEEKLQKVDFEGDMDMFQGFLGQSIAIKIASNCGYHFDKQGRLKSNMHERDKRDRYDLFARSDKYEALKRLNTERDNMETSADIRDFIGTKLEYRGKAYEFIEFEEPLWVVLQYENDKRTRTKIHLADFNEMWDDGEIKPVLD